VKNKKSAERKTNPLGARVPHRQNYFMPTTPFFSGDCFEVSHMVPPHF